MGKRRGCGRLVIAVLVAAVWVVGAPADAAEYSVLGEASMGTGVTYRALRQSGPVTIHVAEIAAGAPVRFEAVLSNDQVADGFETTSSMCSRAGGIVCVNADFTSCVGCPPPFGGLVHDGVPLRSPTPYHGQVSVGPAGWTSDPVQWTSRLTATYQVHVPEADPVAALLGSPGQTRVDTRELAIDGINVDRPGDGLVLYTPAYAGSTRTGPDGVEAIVSADGPPALGTSRSVSLVELRAGGDAPIPANGFVLSGHGAAADALRVFWQEFTDKPAQAKLATIAITTNVAVEESVGGHPVLLQQGQVVDQDFADPFITARHPRTLLGWNATGAVWLVVVDGRSRGYSRGLTIPEAADLLLQLGATDGINLDGGGSSTFVASGMCGAPCIANRPSDGRERLVTTALAVVPLAPAPAPAAPPVVTPEPAPPVASPQPAPAPGVTLPAVPPVEELLAPLQGLVAPAEELLAPIEGLQLPEVQLPDVQPPDLAPLPALPVPELAPLPALPVPELAPLAVSETALIEIPVGPDPASDLPPAPPLAAALAHAAAAPAPAPVTAPEVAAATPAPPPMPALTSQSRPPSDDRTADRFIPTLLAALALLGVSGATLRVARLRH